jgi:hypothetical protein
LKPTATIRDRYATTLRLCIYLNRSNPQICGLTTQLTASRGQLWKNLVKPVGFADYRVILTCKTEAKPTVRPTQQTIRDAMTRFPTMRRYMRASAVAVPSLLFAAFLLIAAGHCILMSAPLIGAFVLFLAFPYYISDGVQQRPQTSDSDTGVLRWIRRAAKYAILMWFVFQPEVESFQKRIMDGGALWDWRLITPVAVLAIYSVISGLRRSSRVTDAAIYSYFTTADDSRLTTSTAA